MSNEVVCLHYQYQVRNFTPFVSWPIPWRSWQSEPRPSFSSPPTRRTKEEEKRSNPPLTIAREIEISKES